MVFSRIFVANAKPEFSDIISIISTLCISFTAAKDVTNELWSEIMD
mgnify:CR=1 FL=1